MGTEFFCVSKEQVSKSSYVISMIANDTIENDEIFNGVPKGKLSIGPFNRETADQFIVGDRYIVTFERVENQ